MHRTLVWTGKGGTGKTTSVANLGPELAYLGARVLLVGFDPQADLEASYDITPDAPTIADALTGHRPVTDCLTEIALPGTTHGGTLHLLPASPVLDDLLGAFADGGHQSLDLLLGQLDEAFDIALIDTQGAITPLSDTAAHAADTVLFVMEPGAYESRALAKRLGEIQASRTETGGWRMKPLGVVFMRTPARSSSLRLLREQLADTETYGAEIYVFEHHTRPQTSVQLHPLHGRPTVMVEPDSNVGRDYRRIAAELLQQLNALYPAAA
ncbi:ParA family protein [Conexibacter sp. W3-3-2]|uniref:ParA family protein n=1 Tax=Conexibacter sp. W3-3-2 TaxID=2675227 RepID=UPI0018AC6222|nr:ParA family protein [Conexibacter sp. W3-3-2]